jgi:hypothetical protein
MRWQKPEGHLGGAAFLGTCMRLAAAVVLIVGATFSDAQDFQSWNEVDLTASWKNVDFLVPLLARVDSSLPNPQLAATGITADFRLPWHLTLTGGYLFAVLPQRSLDVHLPLVALTPTFKLHRFVLADRNRFEKLVGFANSPVRYRNRFLVDAPFGAKERWHAFIDDEVIFNLTDGDWNQNRFEIGGGRQLAFRIFLDVYYLQRNPGGSAPQTRVAGTTLRINLRPRTKQYDEANKI